jgi:hypothetical protein
MRTPSRSMPVRSMAVSLLRLIVLAAFAMALTFAPAPARAANDDKDWKVMGELKIKDAKDAPGGAGKRGDGNKKDGDKKNGGKKAEAGTAAGEIDVAPTLVKRIKFEVRGAEVEF